jgi:hypothetical protein
MAAARRQDGRPDWRPAVLHGWSGFSASLFMAALMAGIIALFVEFQRSALYETAFVYQTSFHVSSGMTLDIAPYSIVPTLLAVFVKLWWGSLESTFRRLQPYVSMAGQSTKASCGILLSYVDSVMLWTSWKASKNKHWLLALVTCGAFLTEVCKCDDSQCTFSAVADLILSDRRHVCSLGTAARGLD